MNTHKENKCRFFWDHDWGKWEDSNSGLIERTYLESNRKFVVGLCYEQKRRCLKCNKLQTRGIETR